MKCYLRWILPLAQTVFLAGLAAQPSNDLCAGRQVIPGTGPFPYKTTTIDISAATTEGDPNDTAQCLSIRSSSVWYEFRPAITALYTISSCGDRTATTVEDTVMAIFASDGPECSGYQQIACADDVCGTQAEIAALLTANTTFYIVVWRYGNDPAPPSSAARLQLAVTIEILPENDTCAHATPLPLHRVIGGFTLGGTNNYELPGREARGPDVVYSFDAAEEGTYSFAVKGYMGANLILYATTNCPAHASPASMSNLVSVADRNKSGISEELVCVQLGAGQRLFVFVDDQNPDEPGSTFIIEAARCLREREPNDSTLTADHLFCGVQGNVSPTNDADLYLLGSFPMDSRLFAMVDAAAAIDPALVLSAHTADRLLETDSGDNDEAFGQNSSNLAGTPLTNTPIFLRVSYPFANATNEPYRLYAVVRPPLTRAALELEPNHLLNNANAGTYFQGRLVPGDEDLFRFDAQAGDLLFVSLDCNPLRDASRLQPQLTLLDSNGAYVFGVDDRNPSSYPSGEALVYRLNHSGTYYVRVSLSPGATTTGSYLLSITRNCFVTDGANTPPALVDFTGALLEGTLALRGTVSDLDVSESFLVAVSWSDGSPDTLTNLPPGVTTFELTHTAVDALRLAITDRSGGVLTSNLTFRPQSPRLSARVTSDARILLGLQGTPYALYRIESSSDLQSWNTLVRRPADGNGHFLFEDPSASRPRFLFYRAVAP